MATQVKVAVPEGASWDALVEVRDEWDGVKTTATTVLKPGQASDFHVTSTRQLLISERAHKPVSST